MSNLSHQEILNETFAFAPPAGEEGQATAPLALEKIPAKMAVYLIEGEGNEPLLLATVGDLRAAIGRRMADLPADARSKRVPYRQLARNLRYRLVNSPFAANLWYYQV